MIETLCSFPGCAKPVRQVGLCNAHVMQRYRRQALAPLRKIRRVRLIANPDIAGTLLVPLTLGLFAIIDEADGEAVGRHLWHALVRPESSRTAYAASKGIKLHAFLWRLWGMPPAPEIDHRDTNGLNCTRANLRAATRKQNASNQPLPRHNTSGLKGVRRRPSGRWEAAISIDRKLRFLGTFATKEAAARAYDLASIAARGEFARTNRAGTEGIHDRNVD